MASQCREPLRIRDALIMRISGETRKVNLVGILMSVLKLCRVIPADGSASRWCSDRDIVNPKAVSSYATYWHKCSAGIKLHVILGCDISTL